MDSLTGYILSGIVFAALIEYGMVKWLPQQELGFGVRIAWILFWPICLIFLIWGYIKGIKKK